MKKIIRLLLVILFLTACHNEKEKTIKIGVILPFTGPAAGIGNTIFDGIKLAVKDINKRSNIKFQLVTGDSKIDPIMGIAAANKLINVNHVKAIIGVASSPVALLPESKYVPFSENSDVSLSENSDV